MALRVPVLGTDYDTVLHRRDPRVKILMFATPVAVLYVPPSWPWLAATAAVGLIVGVISRVPPLWLTVLWLLQIPAIIGFFVVPVVGELVNPTAGGLADEISYGLRLTLAWAGALFVSISLFSTMRVEELTDGMRGLRIPEVLCFAVGYAFVLIYTSLNDIFRIVDALRIKGVDLESKNPLRFVRNVGRLLIPALFTTVRRASTMMAALQMRGASFAERAPRITRVKFDVGDAVLLSLGTVAVALPILARLGVLVPFAGLPFT